MSTSEKRQRKIEVCGKWIDVDEKRYQEWLKYVCDESERESQRKRLEYEQGVRGYRVNALRLI
jgi:hypothetical protein